MLLSAWCERRFRFRAGDIRSLGSIIWVHLLQMGLLKEASLPRWLSNERGTLPKTGSYCYITSKVPVFGHLIDPQSINSIGSDPLAQTSSVLVNQIRANLLGWNEATRQTRIQVEPRAMQYGPSRYIQRMHRMWSSRTRCRPSQFYLRSPCVRWRKRNTPSQKGLQLWT